MRLKFRDIKPKFGIMEEIYILSVLDSCKTIEHHTIVYFWFYRIRKQFREVFREVFFERSRIRKRIIKEALNG